MRVEGVTTVDMDIALSGSRMADLSAGEGQRCRCAATGAGVTLTGTLVSHLAVALRAGAPVRALRVDTLVLAHVLAGGALVQVPAAGAIQLEHEAGRAQTAVRAVRVLTVVPTRWW